MITESATRYRLILAVIFLFAFGLRLAATARFEGLREGPRRTGFSDGVEFNAIANNLITHGEYAITPGQPTSFRAPGFPFFLAGIYTVAGSNNFLVFHIIQAIISAALVLVVAGIGTQLAGRTVGLVAAALTTIYPNIFYYCIHFSSEPLYTLLLAAATCAFIRAVQGRCYLGYVLGGLLLGAAALTRPLAIYFFPVFGLVALGLNRSHWRGVILSGVAMALVVAPWTIRNHRVHERFLLLVSNGGSTFWGANNEIVLKNPQFHGQWISTERMTEQKANVNLLKNEVDRDRLEWAYGKQFLRANPAALPRLTWYKFREFWTPFCKTPNKALNLIILVTYAPLLPLMVAGLIITWRKSAMNPVPFSALLVMLVPMVMSLLGSLAFYGSARFRSTIEPLLLIFAATAITRFLAARFPRLNQ